MFALGVHPATHRLKAEVASWSAPRRDSAGPRHASASSTGPASTTVRPPALAAATRSAARGRHAPHRVLGPRCSQRLSKTRRSVRMVKRSSAFVARWLLTPRVPALLGARRMHPLVASHAEVLGIRRTCVPHGRLAIQRRVARLGVVPNGYDGVAELWWAHSTHWRRARESRRQAAAARDRGRGARSSTSRSPLSSSRRTPSSDLSRRRRATARSRRRGRYTSSAARGGLGTRPRALAQNLA